MKNWNVVQEFAEYIVYALVALGLIWSKFRGYFKSFDWHYKEAVKGNLSITSQLEIARLKLNADRVDLMYSSNGGGIPRPAEKIYTSLIMEAISDRQVNYIGKWDNELAGEAYLDVLNKIIINGQLFISDINELQPSKLRAAAKSTGVRSFFFFNIMSARNKNYYGVVSWNDQENINEKHEEIVRILKSELKKLIQ